MIGRRRRVLTYDGPAARLQAIVIKMAARVSRPMNHRGVQRFSWWVSRFFDGGNSVVLEGDGGKLRINLADGYWTPLLDPRFCYEPEVAALLDATLSPSTLFLDCGANLGYWSVLGRGHARRVVAVEASPLMYAQLRGNAALNDEGIVCVNAAVWSTSEAELQITSHPLLHAAASVVDVPGSGAHAGADVAVVPARTIDELVSRCDPEDVGPVVVKLDVEGAEIPAIEGAAETLSSRDVVLIYEDHGSDAGAAVSAFLLDRGFMLFAPVPGTAGGSRFCRVTLEDIRSAKTNPWRGYNYAACRPDSCFADLLTGSASKASGRVR